VETRTCVGGDYHQLWYNQNDRQLYNYWTGTCLEVDLGAHNGTQAALSACTGASNLQWHTFWALG
jgi:hypothetical protein